MATNPTLITTPFAQSGDKTTPPNTNTPSDGRFSQTLGFPPVTAIPLGSGGKAPKREDFNGAFNMLSNIAFYAQKGWVFEWDSGQTYYAGCIVRYSGNLYACTSDVTSTTAPSSDTSHWSKYNISPGTTYAPINSPAFTGTPTAPTPSSSDNSTKIATTAFVKSVSAGGGGYNTRDIITTSGTYTAPVTGWYKITVKGGGGGGGSGMFTSSSGWSGAGGGEGGTTIGWERLDSGDTVTVVVGAGGAGGAGGASSGHSNAGTAGGNTSVTIGGNVYTAYGGGAPTTRATQSPLPGGTGGAGTINGFAGGYSGQSYGNNACGSSGGGAGGGVGVSSAAGNAGINGGGGAGGGANQNSASYAGGAGGNGFVWFEYFDTSLNP